MFLPKILQIRMLLKHIYLCVIAIGLASETPSNQLLWPGKAISGEYKILHVGCSNKWPPIYCIYGGTGSLSARGFPLWLTFGESRDILKGIIVVHQPLQHKLCRKQNIFLHIVLHHCCLFN